MKEGGIVLAAGGGYERCRPEYRVTYSEGEDGKKSKPLIDIYVTDKPLWAAAV